MPPLPNPAWSEEAPDPSLSEDHGAPVVLSSAAPLSEIQALERDVKAIEITDAQLRERAMRLLIYTETKQRKMELDMAKAVKPALEEEARIRKPFQFDIGALKSLALYTRGKIRTWDQAELAKARLQQTQKNLQIDARNQEAANQAEEKGLPAPMMKAPTVVEVSAAQVKTEEGSAKRKIVKAWTIHGFNREDADQAKELAKLPASDPRLKEIDRAHLVLNIKLLDSLVELGQEPPGLVLYDDVEIKTRRGRNTA